MAEGSENNRHFVLKYLYMRYENFVADSQEANPTIDLGRAAPEEILKLLRAFFKSNGGYGYWLQIAGPSLTYGWQRALQVTPWILC
jgi:hypothetical protein